MSSKVAPYFDSCCYMFWSFGIMECIYRIPLKPVLAGGRGEWCCIFHYHHETYQNISSNQTGIAIIFLGCSLRCQRIPFSYYTCIYNDSKKRNISFMIQKNKKNESPSETRTPDLLVDSRTPYPLDHGGFNETAFLI